MALSRRPAAEGAQAADAGARRAPRPRPRRVRRRSPGRRPSPCAAGGSSSCDPADRERRRDDQRRRPKGRATLARFMPSAAASGTRNEPAAIRPTDLMAAVPIGLFLAAVVAAPAASSAPRPTCIFNVGSHLPFAADGFRMPDFQAPRAACANFPRACAYPALGRDFCHFPPHSRHMASDPNQNEYGADSIKVLMLRTRCASAPACTSATPTTGRASTTWCSRSRDNDLRGHVVTATRSSSRRIPMIGFGVEHNGRRVYSAPAPASMRRQRGLHPALRQWCSRTVQRRERLAGSRRPARRRRFSHHRTQRDGLTSPSGARCRAFRALRTATPRSPCRLSPAWAQGKQDPSHLRPAKKFKIIEFDFERRTSPSRLSSIRRAAGLADAATPTGRA